MSIGTDVVGLGVGAVFDAAGQWVASGADWILQQLVAVVTATTAPPIGTAWFTARLGTMTAIGAALALPLTCLAAVQAVVRQSPGLLVRTVVVHLPVGVACTGTAVAVVQMGLSVTDDLSRQVLAAAGTGAGSDLSPVAAAIGAMTGVPSFALLLCAVLVAVAGLTLWLEMAVRAAAVSVAVLFLPLVMAAMVWPAVGHWCRRLAETLAALVLSKLVVVGALALAAQSLAEGLAAPSGGGFSAAVTGAALLVVAAGSPFALMRLVPAVEAGAVAQLEQARHHLRRAPAAAWSAGTSLLAADGPDAASGAGGPIGPIGPADDGLDDPPPDPGAAAAGRGGGGDGGPGAGDGGAGPGGGGWPGSGGGGWPGSGGGGWPGSGGGWPGSGGGGPGSGGGGMATGADRVRWVSAVLAGTDPGALAEVMDEAYGWQVHPGNIDEAAARRVAGLGAAQAYGGLQVPPHQVVRGPSGEPVAGTGGVVTHRSAAGSEPGPAEASTGSTTPGVGDLPAGSDGW